MSNVFQGHLLAFICTFIWSTTFVSTKILLEVFTPLEILVIRFTIGIIILKLLSPTRAKFDLKKEPYFFLAGLTGVTLYFLLENIALMYTTASNAGILIAIVPLFTSITTKIFYPNEEKGTINLFFILGFILALIGVYLICTQYDNNSEIKINPLGDLLIIISAVVWAFYSVIIKKINTFKGYSQNHITRKSFEYGILCMLPIIAFSDFSISIDDMSSPKMILNLLFLGVLASAVCFTIWSMSVKAIGTITSIIYIYLSPALTVITAYIILGETITSKGFIGCILVILGLFLSNKHLMNIFTFKKLAK